MSARPAKAREEQAAPPPRQPNDAGSAAPGLVRRLLAWLRPPRPFPMTAAAAAGEQAKRGAPSSEQGAPKFNLERPVYEAPKPAVAPYSDGIASLECTGELVPVLFDIRGPAGMGMHVVAPMGLHAVERAQLQRDATGLRIILELAGPADDDSAAARPLND